MNQMVLNKGEEVFIFSYGEGNEGDLLAIFLDFAKNPKISFDWIDAAVLTRRVFSEIQTSVFPEYPEIVLLKDKIKKLISDLICGSERQ